MIIRTILVFSLLSIEIINAQTLNFVNREIKNKNFITGQYETNLYNGPKGKITIDEKIKKLTITTTGSQVFRILETKKEGEIIKYKIEYRENSETFTFPVIWDVFYQRFTIDFGYNITTYLIEK